MPKNAGKRPQDKSKTVSKTTKTKSKTTTKQPAKSRKRAGSDVSRGADSTDEDNGPAVKKGKKCSRRKATSDSEEVIEPDDLEDEIEVVDDRKGGSDDEVSLMAQN